MELKELDGLTFAHGDAESIDAEICAAVEAQLGRKLARGDPIRLLLRGIEAVLLQQRLLIDETGKQNLLAYARGNALEHLGALVGVERKQPVSAVCTMELRLSTARMTATNIAAGTRFTAGDDVFFALNADVTFAPGETVSSGSATCLTAGTLGNSYAIGEINSIVDPQPYLQAARNITVSEGGSDLESDAAYRERIHAAPESYSTAGPIGAYRWHAMNASPLITDVSVRSPSPGEVEIRPLLKGGELPNEEMLKLVEAAVNDRRVRPLTDHVTVLTPGIVSYQIAVYYRIARSNATRASAIESAVNAAVREYALWQKEELGRDIEPSELLYRMRAAGAKHIDLNAPTYAAVESYEAAIATQINVVCHGLEDD